MRNARNERYAYVLYTETSCQPDNGTQYRPSIGRRTRPLIRVYIALNTHCENTPIQIYWTFSTKNWKFGDKNSDIFHISAQNIDFEYLLEPPRRGGSNEYPLSMFLSRNNYNNCIPL